MPDYNDILEFIKVMRWQDWVDIVVVAVIVYQAIRLIRGTRSMQMLLGMGLVIVAWWFSSRFDLLTLNWILSNFLTYLIIILVILFQADIRRGLTQVALLSFSRTAPEFLSGIGEVVKASYLMAERRIGAIIIFEREVGLKNITEAGTAIDAQISADLLLSIFNTKAPLHDGAVIIQNNRVAAAACFLPLSPDDEVSRSMGTRHRAALRLTMESDAAAVVVSEERGMVSLVLEGEIKTFAESRELRQSLTRLLNLSGVHPDAASEEPA